MSQATLDRPQELESAETRRYIRQRGLVPQERLDNTRIIIIGVGAIGRQVALMSAVMGASEISLIDFDTVEVENLGAQGYRPDQLQRFKSEATRDDLLAINENANVEAVTERFQPNMTERWRDGGRTPVVFACVDTMGARRFIFEKVFSNRLGLLIDTRMRAEAIRILTACPAYESDLDFYLQHLHDAADATPESCTARSTYYTSSIAAGLALYQLRLWLSDKEPQRDMWLDLPGILLESAGPREMM